MAALKNARHEIFAQGVAKGLSATDAYEKAGYKAVPCADPAGFYVYVLVDSRDDSVFYVGKGKGHRYAAHLAEWRRNSTVNPRKLARIGEIVQAGATVKPMLVEDGLSEADAYRMERHIIFAVGLEVLTNLLPGQLSEKDRAMLKAKGMKARLKPFDVWVSERPRTLEQIDMAKRVYAEVDLMIAGDFCTQVEICGGVATFS